MGTSKSYSGRSIVPSFVGGSDDSAPAGYGDASGLAADGLGAAVATAAGVAAGTAFNGSFSGARRNFSQFASSRDRGSLERAASGYVRNGAGGAARAAQSMGIARETGGRLLGLVRDFQQNGPGEALRRFNLQDLAGRPARQVLLATLEFVCPPGGTIDEGLARQAMLDAIGDLAADGVVSFDQMNTDQLNELFLDFVARTIEGRIVADMGNRGIVIPEDVASAMDLQAQIHDFVLGCTRTVIGEMDGVPALTDQQLEGFVSRIYETTFTFIGNLGDGE